MQPDEAIRIPVAAREEPEEHAPAREREQAGEGRSQRSSWSLLPLALFFGFALLGPVAVQISPATQDLLGRLQPPVFAGGSWDHPLGTDGLGRDMLARLAHGARFSLLVGLVAAVNASVVGVLLGAIAGLVGGVIDHVVTALVAVVMAIPAIVTGIVVTAALGQSLINLLVILLLGGWVVYARVVRLQTAGIVRSEYVEAAHALGAGRWHILWQHLIPNLAPTVMVLAAQGIASVMVYEATLTYLGLGLPVETVTLGSLVREGQQVLFSAWWVGLFPGALIALAVVGFNFAADWAQARLRAEQVSGG